nr:hypothetical protein CFP56_14504 [Quercus suber]
MEYRSAQPKKTVAAPTVRPHARWSPPPVGWFKANFDAAIFQDVGRVGLGVILRDSQGLALVSLAQNIQLASSEAEMEALAATRALELAAELGFDRVIFEGDSTSVITSLTDQIWTIWYRRNNVRTAPPGFPLNLIVQRAFEALMEYRSAQPKKFVAAPMVRPRARWTPPPVGWFKANFDAAVFQDVDRAGLGVIFRDSQGAR